LKFVNRSNLENSFNLRRKSMLDLKKSVALLIVALVATSSPLATHAATIQSTNRSTPAASQIAAWYDRLPMPTGIYMNIDGQGIYLGEYAQTGDEGVYYKGSTWEIKSDGQVIAHGYGRIGGRFYRWACSRFGC
jgi:hypothetical protein